MIKGAEYSDDDNATQPKVKKPTRPSPLWLSNSITPRWEKTVRPQCPLVVLRCPNLSAYRMAKWASTSPIVTRNLRRQRSRQRVTMVSMVAAVRSFKWQIQIVSPRTVIMVRQKNVPAKRSTDFHQLRHNSDQLDRREMVIFWPRSDHITHKSKCPWFTSKVEKIQNESTTPQIETISEDEVVSFPKLLSTIT